MIIELNTDNDIWPLVIATVKKCKAVLRRSEHELGDLGAFTTHLRKNRVLSCADESEIIIGLEGVARWMARGYYPEYAAISKDPIIGGFDSNNWEDYIRCIVCHEVAHTAQMRYQKRRVRVLKNRNSRPHGDAWQYLYRLLRKELVNPYLPKSSTVGQFNTKGPSND